LLFYSTISTSQFQPLLDAFHNLYPWLEVQYLELSPDEAIERYLSESGTGSPTASLLFSAAPLSWMRVIQKGEMIDYTSPEKSYLLHQESPHPGLYAAGNDPLILIWNKLLVPEELAPTGLADLVAKVDAHPDVFRNIASYAVDKNGYAYAAHHALVQHHGDKIWDWYKILGPHNRYESSIGVVVEKIMSGEYSAGYVVPAATALVTLAKNPAAGKVYGVNYISDGDPVSIRSIGAVKSGTSPNAAKLMLDFILSKEGQKRYGQIGRPPARTDMTSADIGGGATLQEVIDEIGKENLLFLDADASLIDDYDSVVKRWKEASGVE
jgi:iron(III) transport system substrate-binding protein